jgi:hypothetical protein
MRRIHSFFLSGSLAIAFAMACGSSSDSTFLGGNGNDGGGGGSSGAFPITEGGADPNQRGEPIEIAPVDRVVTFETGQPAPTVQFVASLVATKQAVPAVFSIDRGEIGAIGASSGLFTASGSAGGTARISAAYNGVTVSTNITVKLKVTDNGGPPLVDAGGGAGGNGGVGGHGPGGTVQPGTIAVLEGTPVADPGLSLLYPYDGTVWPRGILAPLLMWKPGAEGDYDALLIRIQETNFEYEGVFAKNSTTTPFQDHPILQQAWKQMLTSNGGEEVTITLVLAKGTTAYGPLTVKWKVASAPLKGVVYYNSYGTNLAKNYGGVGDEKGALPDNRKFGGATLAIRGNSTDPVLVAGGNGNKSYCRVCHSVAANGSALLTQRGTGDEHKFSTYDLKVPGTAGETTMAPEGDTASYSWSAVYPDGSMFFRDSSDADGSTSELNKLYQTVTGTGPKTPAEIPTTGWPAGLRAAFPAFSPDGKNVAFTKYATSGGADKRTLAYTPFDNATKTFGTLRDLYRPPNGAHSALYPAFLPTNNGLVFEVETRSNGRNGEYGETRADADGGDVGTRAELWWANVHATDEIKATRLDKLNGLGYLPAGPNAHDHDETLNYEPTVNPVPSGGYAWVVFTSRRMYGNVATINPYWSDPRYKDITVTPTTKKLWVAAIDLNAPPGTDPSHPAFYLPAQELLAGNMRGYWVVDPCQADGNACETGDECCGGYCRPNGSGALVCSNVVPQCAQEFERCTTNADCCNSPNLLCINSRCATPDPR